MKGQSGKIVKDILSAIPAPWKDGSLSPLDVSRSCAKFIARKNSITSGNSKKLWQSEKKEKTYLPSAKKCPPAYLAALISLVVKRGFVGRCWITSGTFAGKISATLRSNSRVLHCYPDVRIVYSVGLGRIHTRAKKY
jgi:hypothetical protein